MWQIFTGSVLLSVIHALIPNHWAPLVALSKGEKWNTSRTWLATIITSVSHIASTILIGIIVGIAGLKLFEKYSMISGIVPPAILFVIGLIYIVTYRASGHSHEHTDIRTDRRKTGWPLLISLCVAMFFTPCVEIELYYFQAAAFGWKGIAMVSLVYAGCMIVITSILVFGGLKGVSRFNMHFLEHHEKIITGITLILLSGLAYFVSY
jgi:nickel/cobalt transporter (NicO) family protein